MFDAPAPVRSAEDRFLLLQQHADTLGFSGSHYAVFTRRGGPTSSYRVIFSTLPSAYHEAYDAAGFLADDPIPRRPSASSPRSAGTTARSFVPPGTTAGVASRWIARDLGISKNTVSHIVKRNRQKAL
jgi:hypothetical protein